MENVAKFETMFSIRSNLRRALSFYEHLNIVQKRIKESSVFINFAMFSCYFVTIYIQFNLFNLDLFLAFIFIVEISIFITPLWDLQVKLKRITYRSILISTS